mgnify:CR=1 FL=1
MDIKIENNENEKNEAFLEILKNETNSNPTSNQKILFFTTDSWLAQLGSRKNN